MKSRRKIPRHVLVQLRRTMMREVEVSDTTRNCEHCGVDLYPEEPEPLGFFMLSDALWEVVSIDEQIKCLCLTCTEEVLGDRLPSWTFRPDAMVPAVMLTKDLQDRLDPATDGEFNVQVDEERVAIAARVFPTLEIPEMPEPD